MISGASEEELNIACIRADIMVALEEKYGNYDLLDKLDKFYEKENKEVSVLRLSYGDYVNLDDYFKLKKELEEKDKIFDKTLIKIKHVYNMLNKYKENHIICFDKDLWGVYKRMNKELAEILESGKNGKLYD